MLHTVNKSPFEGDALQSCFNHATAGSGILLLEDGVIAAMKGTKFSDAVAAKAKECKVYALGGDLKARGLAADNVVDGITVVDYEGFVDAAIEHGTVQAWV